MKKFSLFLLIATFVGLGATTRAQSPVSKGEALLTSFLKNPKSARRKTVPVETLESGANAIQQYYESCIKHPQDYEKGTTGCVINGLKASLLLAEKGVMPPITVANKTTKRWGGLRKKVEILHKIDQPKLEDKYKAYTPSNPLSFFEIRVKEAIESIEKKLQDDAQKQEVDRRQAALRKKQKEETKVHQEKAYQECIQNARRARYSKCFYGSTSH